MIKHYIEKITTRYTTGIAREHSYRGDLQHLLEALANDVLVTNEPARIACGAPDYILTRGHIPIGYIEAKDIRTAIIRLRAKSPKKTMKSLIQNIREDVSGSMTGNTLTTFPK